MKRWGPSRSRLRDGRVIYRLGCGAKLLRFKTGYYSRRRVIPFVERGQFRCWNASWSWGQISWELSRWT